MTEKLTGQYTYGKGYPESMQGTSVAFNLEWTNNDGELTGICTDDEGKKVFDEPATIKGFIEGTFINFIKKYPCFWAVDEKGNNQIFENIPPIEINYYGDLIDGIYSGEWEIYMEVMNERNEMQLMDCAGTWSMQKDN